MIQYRWHSDKRYYLALLYQDLLGDWIVHSAWGGRHNANGNDRCEIVPNIDAGQDRLQAIDKRRRQHGYDLVSQQH